VGGLAVDEDGGRAEAERAEIGAGQLDFSVGESGGGNDGVDARLGENFRGGLGAGAGHDFDL
jgi:hypothetical protein